MFHVKDGLCFERLECGAVRIIMKHPDKEDCNIFEQIIDPSSWASVVSTVSSGDSAEMFQIAQAMQQGFCTAQEKPCTICGVGPK